MLAAQGGHCALCPATESRPGFALSVDHDHASGHVRGLLCAPCNKILGFVEGGRLAFASTIVFWYLERGRTC